MMRRAILYGLTFFSLLGCGKADSETCTLTVGEVTAVPTSRNNSQCPVGEVLVGYNPNAITGPLLCAALTVSCPVPRK